MWHVAIITDGYLPVTAVLPGGKFRSHYMAIDASLRLIRQIGYGIGNVQRIYEYPNKKSDQYIYIKKPI
jgi:hypothetical protein